MIDIHKETLISFGKASRLLPDNPSLPTFWRWSTQGVNGVRLEFAKIGKKRYTSREALQRFVTASTEAVQPEPEISTDATERDAATKRRLRKGGLLAPEIEEGPVETPDDDEATGSGTEVTKE